MQPSMMASLVALLALAGGCAMDGHVMADGLSEQACARADALVQSTQARLAEMRAQIATTKIDAAKKEAELQQLRRQVESLRGERATLHQVQVKHQEDLATQEMRLQAVEQERDRLADAKRTLEAALKKVSRGREAVADPAPVGVSLSASPVEAKVDALEASVTALTAQIQHLRSDADDTLNGQAAGLFSIRVARGDTLSKLARRYGVSVADIQDANGLSGDLILIGQRLFIPAGGLRQ